MGEEGNLGLQKLMNEVGIVLEELKFGMPFCLNCMLLQAHSEILRPIYIDSIVDDLDLSCCVSLHPLTIDFPQSTFIYMSAPLWSGSRGNFRLEMCGACLQLQDITPEMSVLELPHDDRSRLEDYPNTVSSFEDMLTMFNEAMKRS